MTIMLECNFRPNLQEGVLPMEITFMDTEEEYKNMVP